MMSIRRKWRSKSPVVLESIDFPTPVVQLAIEPKSKPDQEKLGMAIAKLVQEDPTLKVSTDQETGQTILAGMGELHLEIIVERMRREFGVEANVGKPQVAYRETIRTKAEGEGRFVRQSGVRVNTVIVRFALSHWKKVLDLCSSTALLVEPFPRNTFQQFRRA